MKLKEQLKLCKTPFQKKCVNILMHIYWKDYETDTVIPSCDIKQEKNLYFKLKKNAIHKYIRSSRYS